MLSMSAIADNCMNLIALDVNGVKNDQSIIYLIEKRGAQLMSLSIPNSSNITDVAMEAVLRMCLKLKSLDVSGKFTAVL